MTSSNEGHDMAQQGSIASTAQGTEPLAAHGHERAATSEGTKESAMSTAVSKIQRAVQPLLVDYGFAGATLFGSYATGTASANSDVDLYVQVPVGTKTKRVFEFAYDLGEALGVDVDAYGSHEVPTTSKLYEQIQLTGVAL